MAKKITFATSAVTLSSAIGAINAGVEAAKSLGVPMSIVIVDPAGMPKAIARMDGASMLSYEVAYKKAWTAAAAGAPTAGVHQFISGDAGALLSMPHVENFSVVAGGLPIRADDGCAGAVGVSGATSELDVKVAEAVLAAFA